MTRSEFSELAYNDHRTALFYLFDKLAEELATVRAELTATQETVLELAAVVQTPVEA